jgi:spore germination protein GerM
MPARPRSAGRAATAGDTQAAAVDDVAEASSLTLYFSRGDSSVAVRRVAPDRAAGPEAALRELLRGPTDAEQESGIASWFSPETAGMLRSFELGEDGVAHVDFADLAQVIPSASSSAGSELLLRELNGTLFQYPEVQAIEYSIGGSCEAFWNWLQYDCEVVRREDAA